MKWIHVISIALISIVFYLSSLGKAMDPSTAYHYIAGNIGLPSIVSLWVVIFLIIAEVLFACFVWFYSYRRRVLVSAAVFLFSSLIIIAYQKYALHNNYACGCYGAFDDFMPPPLIRNVITFALLVVAYITDDKVNYAKK